MLAGVYPVSDLVFRVTVSCVSGVTGRSVSVLKSCGRKVVSSGFHRDGFPDFALKKCIVSENPSPCAKEKTVWGVATPNKSEISMTTRRARGEHGESSAGTL